MITIAGKTFTAAEAEAAFGAGSVERAVAEAMISGRETYNYDNADQLKFELELRREIIAASRALDRSGMDFEVFRETKCNPEFWDRTEEGGFRLKSGAVPSSAISDIFQNGRLYGTECATAMMIVYYKALLSLYGESLFNRTFPKIELMDWHHIDRLLREAGYVSKRPDYFPGDRRYFANPDVDPLTPQWQGENVIDLGGGLYYGHGIGIRNADSIIRALNRNRSSDADEEARLLDSAGRPDFKKLSDVLLRQRA